MAPPSGWRNPFVHSRPLSPDEAIPRPGVVARLVDLTEGGHNATLHAARRMGKTSVLKQAMHEAENRNIAAVIVDFSDVLSLADVAARLDYSFRALRGPLGRFAADHLASVGVTLPFGLGGVSVGRTAQRLEPEHAVHALLEFPVKLSERAGRRVLVCFDEFQALAELRGLDGLVRSHIQHHGAAAGYVFAGSEPSLLRSLFADRSRPLYGQAELVPLERLEHGEAAAHVARRFQMTGRDPGAALTPLVLLSEGHPQRLMLLAHRLWDITAPGEPADPRQLKTAYEATMRGIDAELRILWDALSANERRVLLAMASDLSPQSTGALQLTGLASPSSAQRSLQSLTNAGIVEQPGAQQPPHITDPLLGHWVRRHAGARPTIYVLPDVVAGGFVVTDGPSLAFVQQRFSSIEEAERAAERLLGGRSANIVVHDTDDPNDLPVWALPG